MTRRAYRAVALLVAWSVGLAGPTALLGIRHARAYDPATTHAGLTERAVLASSLNKVFTRRLGKPLGLFEPVMLDTGRLPVAAGRYLMSRLMALDPAHGYRPTDQGVGSALAWVVAGAVIAGTPAERGQNTFFDPSRGVGLRQGGGAAEFAHSLRLMMDGGGSMRRLATGSNFNFTGPASTQWLLSPDNDVGLVAFYEQLERAVSGSDAQARDSAWAWALLALGGTLAVLQDAGEPAHVRNDFRAAFLGLGSGLFDRGSQFERHVAETYGRLGIPAAGSPVRRPNVLAYISAPDRQGLADRTQRRFFSAGTLPEDGVVDRGTTAQDVLLEARDSLVYGLPGLPRLELRDVGRRRYVYAVGETGGREPTLTATPPAQGARRRVLAYERVPGRVRFSLDSAVHDDSARALLPEIGAYGAGLVDHLFRGELSLKASAEGVEVSLVGVSGGVRAGKLRLYAEDASGTRRELRAVPFQTATTVSVAVPRGTRRLAAVLRAEDDAGPLVAVAEQALAEAPAAGHAAR